MCTKTYLITQAVMKSFGEVFDENFNVETYSKVYVHHIRGLS